MRLAALAAAPARSGRNRCPFFAVAGSVRVGSVRASRPRSRPERPLFTDRGSEQKPGNPARCRDADTKTPLFVSVKCAAHIREAQGRNGITLSYGGPSCESARKNGGWSGPYFRFSEMQADVSPWLRDVRLKTTSKRLRRELCGRTVALVIPAPA